MSRIAALLLVLLLAAAAGGAWLFSQDLDTDVAVADFTPDAPGEELGQAPETPLEKEAESETTPTPQRDEVVAETETDPKTLAIERAPSDAQWISGRVVYPLDAPRDDTLRVVARGRRFADRERGPTAAVHQARVKGDDTFRVAVAKKTKRAYLWVEGRYLYLDPREKVELSKLEGPVVLEPSLGGALSVQVELPDTIEPTPAAWEQIVLTLMMSSDGPGVPRPLEHVGEGEYFVGGLKPGSEYSLRVSSTRFVEQRHRDLKMQPGEVTEYMLTVEEGATIRGRVVDDRGDGLEDVDVNFHFQTREASMSWMDSEDTKSDEDGRFEMTGVALRDVTVKAEKDGYLEFEMDLDPLEPGEVVDDLLIEISQGLGISGLVQWPDGKPVDGGRVTITQESGEWFSFGADATGKTEEDGTFAIFGLTAGNACTVKASMRQDSEHGGTGSKSKRPYWRAEAEGVDPGSEGMILVVRPGNALNGRVVDDTGEPLERFRVRATPRDETAFSFLSEGQISRSFKDETGLFVLEGLVDGEWDVVASSAGYGVLEATRITMPHVGGEVTLVVPRAARIEGMVRGPSGEPVAGATVNYEIIDDPDDIFTITFDDDTETTDAEGRFVFEAVTAGKGLLTVSSDELAAGPSLELEIEPAQQMIGVVLTMLAPARMTGEVDPASAPVAGRTVSIDHEEGDHDDRTHTGEDGKFEFAGMTPGEYTVTLWPPEDPDRSNSDWSIMHELQIDETITVPEGGKVHVVLGAPPPNAIRVYGTVKSGGQGVEVGTPISASRWVDGEQSKSATRTGVGGQYELLVGGHGSYKWTIGKRSSSLVRYERDVPEGESARIDFELPTGTLSGVIRRPGGGPLAEHEVSIARESGGAEDEYAGVWRNRTAETDKEGRYSFANLLPGEYVVRAGGSRTWLWASSNAPYGRKVERLNLKDGEQRALDFDLERSGTIKGTVTKGGLPAESADIFIKDSRGNDLSVWASSQTGADGKFTYRGVNPGTVSVHADLDGVQSEVIEVGVYRDQTAQINLTLPD